MVGPLQVSFQRGGVSVGFAIVGCARILSAWWRAAADALLPGAEDGVGDGAAAAATGSETTASSMAMMEHLEDPENEKIILLDESGADFFLVFNMV